MGTKNDPGEYDCHEKALPDEPTFTLLARDPTASDAILHWANERVVWGHNSATDPQITEARRLALEMVQWRLRRRQ